MQNLVMAAIILAVFAYLDQIFVSTMMIGINPPILGSFEKQAILYPLSSCRNKKQNKS